jgi:hypothetical protein
LNAEATKNVVLIDMFYDYSEEDDAKKFKYKELLRNPTGWPGDIQGLYFASEEEIYAQNSATRAISLCRI